jgi:hypothetical protein
LSPFKRVNFGNCSQPETTSSSNKVVIHLEILSLIYLFTKMATCQTATT